MTIGDYPQEYDRKKHGPYDPGRYYGKPDIALAKLPVLQLPRWLLRRNYSPTAMVACISRAWWRWQHKYIHPRNGGVAPFIQLIIVNMALFYVINWPRISSY